MSYRTRLRLAFLSLLAVAGALGPMDADAAILKRVHSGTTTVTNSTTATSVQLTALANADIGKAFAVCSATTTSDLANKRVTCELTTGVSNAVLSIKADVAPGSNVMTVSYHVAEFDLGVSVQRSVTTFPSTAGDGTDLTQTVTLSTAVDCTKSFVIMGGERTTSASTATNLDERYTIRALLGGASACTSGTTTSLGLTRLESGTQVSASWQVVTMEGASVQRGTSCLGSGCPGNQTATVTLGTAVDTTKSLVLLTRRASSAAAGIEGTYYVGADFASAGSAVSEITIGRAFSTPNVADVAYEVVSFSDGTTVQRPSSNLSVGSSDAPIGTPLTATVATIDRTASVPFFTSVGQANDNNSARLGEVNYRATFPSDTTIGFERGQTGRTGTIAWFAASFYRCKDSTMCSVNATGGNATVTVSWSPLYDLACTSPTTCHALVLKSTSTITATPVNGTPYNVGDGIGAATVVHDGSGATAAQSFTDTTAVSNGTTYYYKVFPKTAATTYLTTLSTSISEVSVKPQGGSLAWSFATTGGATLRPPVTNGLGQAYVPANGQKMIVLRSSDGQPKQADDTDIKPVATPGAMQDYLSWFQRFLAGSEAVAGADQLGFVTMIDAGTGAPSWHVKSPASRAVAAVTVQVAGPSWITTPAFHTAWGSKDLIYVPGGQSLSSNSVYALDASDGSQVFTFTGSPAMDEANGQAFVDYSRDRLWVSSRAGSSGLQKSLWVVDTLTGSGTSSFAMGHISGGPALAYDYATVYVGNEAGELWAVNADSETVKWSIPVPVPPSGNPVAITTFVWEDFWIPGRLYFVAREDDSATGDPVQSHVYCVEDNGTSADLCADWPTNPVTPLPGGFVGQAMVGDTNMWLGGDDGQVHQISLADGAIHSTPFLLESGVTLGGVSADVDNDGNIVGIYVGSNVGKAYKITLTNGSLP